MSQKIAFLYLDTGGGHVAPARALARGIEEKYGNDSSATLLNGFSKNMPFIRFFFEDGYRITSNYFEGGYVLFYQITRQSASMRFGNYFLEIHGLRHLVNFFRKEGITKVVCLHEVLTMVTRKAINIVNPSIPLITIVTDPFTAHPLWYYEKNMDLVVFSEKLRKEAVTRYGFNPSRISVFPFILSRAYERRYTEEEKDEAKRRLGIPAKGKILLIAGGGEGLSRADSLVREFVRLKRTETLIVVCGRNRLLEKQVTKIAERAGVSNILVYGFVNFMSDLLNCADCVVTKGGASTVMEVLAVGKPVIFSTFIRGQELGNVLYAVNGGAGWYIRKPSQILARAIEVMENPDLASSVRENIDRLKVRNGLDDIVRFIHDFSEGSST